MASEQKKEDYQEYVRQNSPKDESAVTDGQGFYHGRNYLLSRTVHCQYGDKTFWDRAGNRGRMVLHGADFIKRTAYRL